MNRLGSPVGAGAHCVSQPCPRCGVQTGARRRRRRIIMLGTRIPQSLQRLGIQRAAEGLGRWARPTPRRGRQPIRGTVVSTQTVRASVPFRLAATLVQHSIERGPVQRLFGCCRHATFGDGELRPVGGYDRFTTGLRCRGCPAASLPLPGGFHRPASAATQLAAMPAVITDDQVDEATRLGRGRPQPRPVDDRTFDATVARIPMYRRSSRRTPPGRSPNWPARTRALARSLRAVGNAMPTTRWRSPPTRLPRRSRDPGSVAGARCVCPIDPRYPADGSGTCSPTAGRGVAHHRNDRELAALAPSGLMRHLSTRCGPDLPGECSVSAAGISTSGECRSTSSLHVGDRQGSPMHARIPTVPRDDALGSHRASTEMPDKPPSGS